MVEVIENLVFLSKLVGEGSNQSLIVSRFEDHNFSKQFKWLF